MAFLRFFKRNTVLCIATLAAVITSFLVPPSAEYLSYFDFKTLTCLFITLAVICALKNIKFFTILSRKIVMLTGNLRSLAITLICITFIGSMLIANDMALITFLPLGFLALSVTNNEKYMAYVFILQNIAANLGGMVTPFGNPQNLYLYSKFQIPTGEFTMILLPPFLLAVAMLILGCCLLKKKPLTIEKPYPEPLDVKRSVLYLILFAISILVVFRVINYVVGLVVVTAALLVLDRKAIKMVDYGLLMTFVMFFIFSGNLSRLPAVNRVLSGLLLKNPFLVTIASCQCISNVPTAILLSRFTENYKPLLLGVNIGGTGTLIASLASLITFNEYKILYPEKGRHYFFLFTMINLIFLVVLAAATMLFWL